MTPYGWDIVAYYDLMLVDAPFADILREWQWSSPSATTALFWRLAVVAVALVALRRCRSPPHRLRAARARRHVRRRRPGGARRDLVRARVRRDPPGRARRPPDAGDPSSRRVNLAISLASLAGLAVALVVALARPATWFEQEWPDEQVAAVRAATRDPGMRLFATDGTADWLLWRLPDLRGRIAYDVRFELYDPDDARADRRATGTRRARTGSRSSTATPSSIVDDRGHLRAFRAEPGARR